ncbi:restriction endonuclease subunit S [Streptococcus mutans]|uniref:restriction endonuclease subunit S n=1 Tax=Streptococcus mutans TaxID=1309 RepID=UPI001455C8EB|nr:restriction endonuclease subunit S [Streptococcus mutans]NLQ42786.1 restriction endonuclease subunit S [Streptococcus mutans]
MSKLKLTDVEWGEFKIGNLFDVSNVKGRPAENYNSGNTPYISSSGTNNAVISFVEANENIITNSGVITVDPIKGVCFYHDYDFVGRGFSGASVNILINKNLNKFSGQFICTVIQKTSMSKASYGYLFNGNRLRNGKILLPIDSQGQPNWQFMEDYIKQEQKQQAQKIIDYYERKLVELAGDVVGLDKVEWKTFRFTEVFQEIQRGKRLKKANQTDGPKPYISSTSENNGVDAFIGNETGVRKFEDVLTLANSGSVGSTFYQQFEFVASDHVTALKSENADKYAYLFLSTVVKRLEEKYSFNREINDTRIKREKVILPADKEGNPNFQYMSDFVKKLELDKVQEVLEYIYIYIYQNDDHS